MAVGILRFHTVQIGSAGTFSADYDPVGGGALVGLPSGTIGVDYEVAVTSAMEAVNIHFDDENVGFDGVTWIPSGGPPYYHPENGAATGFARYWKSGATSGGWHFPSYNQANGGALNGDVDEAPASLSNAVSIDMSSLEAGPEPGEGIDIYDPSGAHLITVERPLDWVLYIEDDGPGSFQFAINRRDPQATEANFAKGNVVRVTIPEWSEHPFGDYLLEQGDFDVISGKEEGGEDLTFGGPGTLKVLARAVNDDGSYAGLPTPAPIPAKGIWYWQSTSAGGIFARMVLEAIARGVLSYVTRTFTTLRDTDNVDWDVTGEWQVPIGSNPYDEGARLIKAGWFHWQMRPGFLLDAFVSRGRDLTGGAFGADVVRFERGANIVEDGLKHGYSGAEDATHMFGMGPDGAYRWVEKAGFNPATDLWIERPMEVPSNDDGDIDRAGEAAFEQAENKQKALAFEILSGIDRDAIDVAEGVYIPVPPWAADLPADGSFWVGDLVTLDTGDDEFDLTGTHRVFSLTIRRDAAGTLAPVGVVLNAPYRQPGEDVSSNGAGTGGSTNADGDSTGGGPHAHSAYQRLSEKGQDSGYPSLDSDGLVPSAQLGDGTPNAAALLAGDQTWRKNNLSATVAPAVTDDSGDGYAVGSRWLDVVGEKEYVLADATVGAAVWIELGAGGGGGGGSLVTLSDVDIVDADLSDHDGIRFDLADDKWKRLAHGVPTSPAAPGVNDDESEGYWYLSKWLDTSTGFTYICVDPTNGAAVWVRESNYRDFAYPFQIDGGGLVITTGVKAYIGPFDFDIVWYGWSAYSTDGVSGSINIHLDADTYANHPPTSGDVITASDPIAISSGTKGQDLSPTGWSQLDAGKVMAIRVSSVTSLKLVDVTLLGRRP